MGAKAAELLYDDEESKAIGITGERIRACGLEEALQMKREFNPMRMIWRKRWHNAWMKIKI